MNPVRRWPVNSWLAAMIAAAGGWLAYRLWAELAGAGEAAATRGTIGDAWVGIGRLFEVWGTLTFGVALVVVVGATVLLVVVLVTVALVRNERGAWVPWAVLGVGLAGALCLHACHAGDKLARRVLVVWCGDGSLRAMGGVELVRKTFGRRADRIFWTLGEKDTLAREERDPERKACYFEASPRGLEALGEAIQGDYRAFAESERFRGPELYELRCFITGHGDSQSRSEGGAGGPSWLQGDPGLGDVRVGEEQIESFGRALPEGIRFKCYVGVCYGHALAEALMRGVTRRTERACAAVLAAPGMKALTHGVVQPADLRLIAAWGRRNTSFLRALWLSQIGQRLGCDKDRGTGNLALSSSEAMVFDFFSERLGLHGVDRHTVVEARARELLEEAEAAHPLDPVDAALLDRCERERAAAIREILPKGCPAELAAAAPGIFQYFESHPAMRSLSEDEQRDILLESRPSLASSLLLRHWLDDAFLRLAPGVQRERFMHLRRCELESWF